MQYNNECYNGLAIAIAIIYLASSIETIIVIIAVKCVCATLLV